MSFVIGEGVAQAAEQGITTAVQSLNPKFLFGNGFNNEVVPEGQPDKLMPPYEMNLIFDGVINFLQTITIPLFETTNLFGNAIDWAGDFILHLDDSEYFRNAIKGIVAAMVPPILLTWFGAGVGNSLVDEVWNKLSNIEAARGRLDDGIAFAHSGFLAPFLEALKRTRTDGSKVDVTTLISYEGVYLDENMFIDNPNLKRIINIWGTADFTHDGDFGPPILPLSNFSGSALGGIDNINIRIEGAFHNDFSYNEEYWHANPPQDTEEIEREFINRQTNLFMRKLYEAALADQSSPGNLELFLRRTPGVVYDPNSKFATVNPFALVLL